MLTSNPQALGFSTSTNFTQNVQSENQSRASSQGTDCPTWVGIASELTQNNGSEINCLQNIFQSCQPFNVTLGYGLGSLGVSIKGIIDGDCRIGLEHEIERGLTNMSCTIPLDSMSAWKNWKRGDGLDAVSDIAKYCKRS